MAEPATSINPTARRAQFRQSRITQLRRRNPRKRRGNVLEFPGGRTIGSTRTSRPIAGGNVLEFPQTRTPNASFVNEEQLYNIPQSPEAAAANNNRRFELERQNAARWNQNRIQARSNYQNFVRTPPSTSRSSRQKREDPDIKAANQTFQEDRSRIINADRSTSSQVRQRIKTIRQLQERTKKFQEQIKKIRATKEKIKLAKRVTWSTGELASTTEATGYGMESIFSAGTLVAMYRIFKMIVIPSAENSDDPDAGQFFRGIFSFLEPTRPKATDPETSPIGIHAIVGYLGLLVAFVLAHVALLFLGASFIPISGALKFFGF